MTDILLNCYVATTTVKKCKNELVFLLSDTSELCVKMEGILYVLYVNV